MQNFLDDLKSAINTTANKAAQKTSEIYERSKITFAISGVQNDIEKLYTEIGKMVYEGHNDNDISLDEVTEKCSEIDLKLQDLADLQMQRAQVKHSKVCPACNAEVTAESTYCAKCGEKL